jgi:hypothetical protein
MRSPWFLVVLAIGCAPTPATTHSIANPGSRGLRAGDHLDAARDHERRAQELARWPDARRSESGRFDDPTTGLWYRAFDTAKEERRLAESHRTAAAAQHAEYAEACGDRPLSEVSVSPLSRYGIGGTNTETGVIVYLMPEAGAREQLLVALRCHRAWMMIETMNMEDCPLDLAGIQIEAYGDKSGASVEITTKDPKLVAELQRRTAHELEAAQRTH